MVKKSNKEKNYSVLMSQRKEQEQKNVQWPFSEANRCGM